MLYSMGTYKSFGDNESHTVQTIQRQISVKHAHNLSPVSDIIM